MNYLFKKNAFLFFTALFGMTISSAANIYTFTNASTNNTPANLWSDAANWDLGILPTEADEVRIDYPIDVPGNECLVDSTVYAYGCHVQISRYQYGQLKVIGGDLKASSVRLAMYEGSSSDLIMSDGLLHLSQTYVGVRGTGAIRMTGGAIINSDMLLVGDYSTGIGHVQLDGGTITMDRLVMGYRGGTGTIDINGGELVINGDASYVVNYVNYGWITACGGHPDSEIEIEYKDGVTTLRGISRKQWTDLGTGNSWLDNDNWAPDMPGEFGQAWIDYNIGGSGPVLDAIDLEAKAWHVYVGVNDKGVLTMDGGGLNCKSVRLAMNTGSSGNLYVNSGSIATEQTYIGVKGNGRLDMTGGHIFNSDMLLIADYGTGHLQLDGGIIKSNRLVMASNGGTGSLDITRGKLVFWDDVRSQVNSLVNAGKITAYGGDPDYTVDVDFYQAPSAFHEWQRVTTITAKAISEIEWTDSGSTSAWGVSDNWDTRVPMIVDDVLIANDGTGPVIDADIKAEASQVKIGGGSTGSGELTINVGGLLKCRQIWSAMYTGGRGNLYINGGVVDADYACIGYNGTSEVNMTQGLLALGQTLVVGTLNGIGHVQLDRGVITVGNSFTNGTLEMGANGTIDITGGEIQVYGEYTAIINGFVSSGKITAYNGDASYIIDVSYDSDKGLTCVKTRVKTATIWSNAGLGNLWSTIGNWNLRVPGYIDAVYIDNAEGSGPEIDSNVHAYGAEIQLGRFSTGELTVQVDGYADFDFLRIARYSNTTGTVFMSGGTINAKETTVGYRGTGKINITGGLIRNKILKVGTSNGNGSIKLDGGTIVTENLSFGSTSSNIIDITQGLLVLVGNQVTLAEGFISSGFITAYGADPGYEPIVTHNGTDTVVKARYLKMADTPYPQEGSCLNLSDGIVLSWESGEGAVSHDLYLGTNFDDVNHATKSQPMGCYKGNLSIDSYAASGLVRGQTYYWRVDEVDYSTIHKGHIWSFTTSNWPEIYRPGYGFGLNDHIVSTIVFHWFNETGHQLTGAWLPVEGRENWTGEPEWWKSQIKQIMASNIDIIYIHLYRHYEQERINLFTALAELRSQGYDVPKVAPFLDPRVIWKWEGYKIDLATTAGKDELANEYIRWFEQYYSVNKDPYADDYIAQIDGRVALNVWWAHFDMVNINQLTRNDLESRLATAFGSSHPVFNNGIYMTCTYTSNHTDPSIYFTFADELISQFGTYYYYDQVSKNGRKTVSVKPGYWDENGRDPGFCLSRDGGVHYENALKDVFKDQVYAWRADNERLFVETWNEYNESSGIYAADPLSKPFVVPGTVNYSYDVWSYKQNPFHYIEATAEYSRIFNETQDLRSSILWHTIPEKINAGRQYEVSVVVCNEGDLKWTAAKQYGFGQKSEGSVFLQGVRLINDNLPETSFYGGVFRGSPVEFKFTITAPQETGSNQVHWSMLQGSSDWFGDELVTTITVYKKSDLNIDGSVNFSDLAIFLAQWLYEGKDLISDFNEDDLVNLEDFGILASEID
jgi:hypothetical protein